MTSRRDFLRSLGIGTTAATAAPWSFGSIHPAVLGPPTQSDSDRPIHLDNNENAYGPSSATIEVIRAALSQVNRYPSAQVEQLAEKIATYHGLNTEQVLLGCGSTEILRSAAETFLGPGKRLENARIFRKKFQKKFSKYWTTIQRKSLKVPFGGSESEPWIMPRYGNRTKKLNFSLASEIVKMIYGKSVVRFLVIC